MYNIMESFDSPPSFAGPEGGTRNSQADSLFSAHHTLATPLLPSPSVPGSCRSSVSPVFCSPDGLLSCGHHDAVTSSPAGACGDIDSSVQSGCGVGVSTVGTSHSELGKRLLAVYDRRVSEANRKKALLELDEFLHVARIHFFAGFLLLPVLWFFNVRMFSQSRLSVLAERLSHGPEDRALSRRVTNRPAEEAGALEERGRKQSVWVVAGSQSHSQQTARAEREEDVRHTGAGEAGMGRAQSADGAPREDEVEDTESPGETPYAGEAVTGATEGDPVLQKLKDLHKYTAWSKRALWVFLLLLMVWAVVFQVLNFFSVSWRDAFEIPCPPPSLSVALKSA
ncbi:presenilin enhancer-2 subunit of gamma secretase, partial [Cystoisospora suis]